VTNRNTDSVYILQHTVFHTMCYYQNSGILHSGNCIQIVFDLLMKNMYAVHLK